MSCLNFTYLHHFRSLPSTNFYCIEYEVRECKRIYLSDLAVWIVNVMWHDWDKVSITNLQELTSLLNFGLRGNGIFLQITPWQVVLYRDTKQILCLKAFDVHCTYFKPKTPWMAWNQYWSLFFLKALKCLWQVCTYWANSTIPFFCCHGYLGLWIQKLHAICFIQENMPFTPILSPK